METAIAQPESSHAEPKLAPMDFDDPFGLESQLTEDERMVRDTAREFAERRLLPGVTAAYLEERFDRGIMSELGACGLLGPTLPTAYGGGRARLCRLRARSARNRTR
jgi:glutaryl-CoA dehydrogenase